MQMPREGSSAQVFIAYGRYAIRRLRRDRRQKLADGILEVNETVKATARAHEDAEEALQDALADRDASDDDLDGTAQVSRNGLAGRGVSANKESPYIDVFPDGIDAYMAAPPSTQKQQYTLLSERLTEHLPSTDPVRKSAVKAIAAGLSAWDDAVAAHEAAERKVVEASLAHRRARDAWRRQVERTYGALVADVGRIAAERYFPKGRGGAKKAKTTLPTE